MYYSHCHAHILCFRKSSFYYPHTYSSTVPAIFRFGTNVSYWIDQGTRCNCLKSECTHHYEQTGEIYAAKGVNGVNNILIIANISIGYSGSVFVLLAYQQPDFFPAGNFMIFPTRNTTTAPMASMEDGLGRNTSFFSCLGSEYPRHLQKTPVGILIQLSPQ